MKMALTLGMLLALLGCAPEESPAVLQTEAALQESADTDREPEADPYGASGMDSDIFSETENDYVTGGEEQYRGFTVDSVLHTEEFAFEAINYNEKMIVLAPQLDDWGERSAEKTIRLTEYFLSHYNIDRGQVFINGYSGGGETLSLVLDKRPELYTVALMCSSKWDGGYEAVTQSGTPVYFVIGESDEYYGAEPFRRAYEEICGVYKAKGLSDEEIDGLVRLDVKPSSYLQRRRIQSARRRSRTVFQRQ